MATQTFVCLYNKFGYCKHQEACRRNHVNELCENLACELSTCNLRHPKTCKWFREYGRCKFDPCAFKHVGNNIEKLKAENQEVLSKLNDIEKALAALEEREQESKETISRLMENSSQMDAVQVLEDKINLQMMLLKR